MTVGCFIHMKAFRAAAVICIIFVSSLVLLPFANADWTMFRSDPSHSGAGTSSPVLTPGLLWSYTSPQNQNTYQGHAMPPPATESSPAYVDGVIYMGSQGDGVYAVNATIGKELWNYTAGSSVEGVQSSPAVVDGVVYIGGGDGNVYALNADNSTKLWNYTIGYTFSSSPSCCGRRSLHRRW